jgi:hypothetical protein
MIYSEISTQSLSSCSLFILKRNQIDFTNIGGSMKLSHLGIDSSSYRILECHLAAAKVFKLASY